MVKKVIGIDFGEARIGIAIGDEELKVAVPLTTIDAKKAEPIEALRKIIEEHDVNKAVVGLPLGLSGKEGRLAALARNFARRIREEIGIEVEMVDERFTSVMAERSVRSLGMKPSRQKKKVDMIAATLILQSYFDARR